MPCWWGHIIIMYSFICFHFILYFISQYKLRDAEWVRLSEWVIDSERTLLLMRLWAAHIRVANLSQPVAHSAYLTLYLFILFFHAINIKMNLCWNIFFSECDCEICYYFDTVIVYSINASIKHWMTWHNDETEELSQTWIYSLTFASLIPELQKNKAHNMKAKEFF